MSLMLIQVAELIIRAIAMHLSFLCDFVINVLLQHTFIACEFVRAGVTTLTLEEVGTLFLLDIFGAE
jgi:hypothetical protein